MKTFRFREFGEHLGTRQLGERVREQLWPLILGDEKVCLDFEGVDVVSNVFADECIAKLLLTSLSSIPHSAVLTTLPERILPLRSSAE